MSAGLVHQGIDEARRVGSIEAGAMFDAWKQAGAKLSRTPALDWRWTRTCFCGRQTATGRVDSGSHVGVPFLTGSEEGRGPLYDLTHYSLEGLSAPIDDPVQGVKVAAPGVGTNGPAAVPIGVYRVGDGVIATIPGEPTKQTGVLVRKAVLDAMPGSGVTHALIGGLALDYIQYVTTPAEYGAQSYEGASTLYGKHEATFFQERLAELGKALASGAPAAAPHAYDPSYGVKPDGAAYPAGADKGTLTAQPALSGGVVTLAWTGGASGADRPVDQAFIRAERIVGKRWRTVDSDLGLDMIWRVDGAGHYTLQWRPAKTVPSGTYRLRVTATRYELVSDRFALS
jgi:neutral ceramidase